MQWNHRGSRRRSRLVILPFFRPASTQAQAEVLSVSYIPQWGESGRTESQAISAFLLG